MSYKALFSRFGGALKNFAYDRHGDSKFAILRSPIFLWGLLGKLFASFFFASYFLSDLFARFVNYYVVSGFQDPYAFFYKLGEFIVFPYPKVMLWFLAFPRWLMSPFLSADYSVVSNLHLFIYRLPLLLADIIILLVLTRWLKTKQEKVLLYYWCSPILFYISYIHGQLDALPVMLLFVSLYLLFKEKFIAAFLFLGLAISAKTAMAIALPFLIIYAVFKKKSPIRVAVLAALPIFIFLLVNAGNIFSEGFFQLVLNNKEQVKALDFNYKIGDQFVLYFVPLAYLVLLVRSTVYKVFNRDVFLMFLGFSFGILTLFIPPMQGWYYWVIPFLIYFFIKENKAPRSAFVLLNIFYFLYFLTIQKSDFPEWLRFLIPSAITWPTPYALLSAWGLPADIVVNISFTLLQGMLLLSLFWMYRMGVQGSMRNKIQYAPYLIGIAGDSGTGKTTYAALIREVFGARDIAVVAGDDMHKWERGDEMWEKMTHLNPRANTLHTELKSALTLRNGESVLRRRYDHTVGKFTIPKKLESKKIIVFEGLHTLFLSKMRTALDLKIFVKPEEELRAHWKMLRDIHERGAKKEKVLTEIERRHDDAKQYIHVQEKHSDICISLRNEKLLGGLVGEKDVPLDILISLRFANDVDIDPLLIALSENSDMECSHSFLDEYQTVEFKGGIAPEMIDKIADALVPDIWETTAHEPKWCEGYLGIIQLFICYYIFEKMKLDAHE
jgi:uridine kinase